MAATFGRSEFDDGTEGTQGVTFAQPGSGHEIGMAPFQGVGQLPGQDALELGDPRHGLHMNGMEREQAGCGKCRNSIAEQFGN